VLLRSLRIVTFGPAPVNFLVISRPRKLNKSRPFCSDKNNQALFRAQALYAISCNLSGEGRVRSE
jgi:hypothetical protein